jgi:hypothetical protein
MSVHHNTSPQTVRIPRITSRRPSRRRWVVPAAVAAVAAAGVSIGVTQFDGDTTGPGRLGGSAPAEYTRGQSTVQGYIDEALAGNRSAADVPADLTRGQSTVQGYIDEALAGNRSAAEVPANVTRAQSTVQGYIDEALAANRVAD